MLPGACHAHADVAAQALGAEVGLEITGVDLLADVVDEIVFTAVLCRAVGVVEVVDVGRVVDAREQVGVEATGDVAQWLRQEEARLRDARGGITACLVALAVIAWVRTLAHPVGIAGVAVHVGVVVLGAELYRVQDAGFEQLGEIGLEVVLLDAGLHPRRVGRACVDLGDTGHQLLLQIGREGRGRRSGEIPRAVQIAGFPTVADFAAGLG